MPAAFPLIILGISAAYLAILILFFLRTRMGRIPSAGASIAVVVAVAVLGVLPTELLSIIWIGLLQSHAEVTASLFMLVPTPIVAGMVAIQALLLARIYRPSPLLLPAIYIGVFAAVYAFWLSRLFNPPADIARYVLVILLVGSAVFGIIGRVYWRRSA